MKISLLILTVLCCSAFTSISAQNSFRSEQLRYSRVRTAYQDAGAKMDALLEAARLEKEGIRICLRAFKAEKRIELWGKNVGEDSGEEPYRLIRTYEVCRTSGVLGPKRRQGDLQIPEGFYHIDRFNPYSNFYLSLGINYPNRSDRILGVQDHLGGDIFIHGDCVTIGCLPITNALIKELYIFCVEARHRGQTTIPVTIFPSELTDEKFAGLSRAYAGDMDRLNLWTDLKRGYDIFNETGKLPSVRFLNTGRHGVN